MSKKTVATIFLFSFLMLSWLNVFNVREAHAVTSHEYILNGGFEVNDGDVTTSSWIQLGGGGATISNSEHHSGSWSHFCYELWIEQISDLNIPTSGISYFGFWHNGVGGDAETTIYYTDDSDSGPLSISNVAVWTFMDLIPHLDAGKSIRNIQIHGGTYAPIYIDDVSLLPTSHLVGVNTSPVGLGASVGVTSWWDIMNNGDFETGLLSPWIADNQVVGTSAFEDYGTYTEVDPNNHISLDTTLFVFTGTRNETAYLYKDGGASYFTNFVHEVKVMVNSMDYGARHPFWAVTNDVGDLYSLFVADKTYLALYVGNDGEGGPFIQLIECYEGSVISPSPIWISLGTEYYLTITKNGVNFLVKVYSDPEHTILLDTSGLSLEGGFQFQYVFACVTWNSGDALTGNTDIGNLGLHSGSTPIPTLDGVTNSDGYLSSYSYRLGFNYAGPLDYSNNVSYPFSPHFDSTDYPDFRFAFKSTFGRWGFQVIVFFEDETNQTFNYVDCHTYWCYDVLSVSGVIANITFVGSSADGNAALGLIDSVTFIHYTDDVEAVSVTPFSFYLAESNYVLLRNCNYTIGYSQFDWWLVNGTALEDNNKYAMSQYFKVSGDTNITLKYTIRYPLTIDALNVANNSAISVPMKINDAEYYTPISASLPTGIYIVQPEDYGFNTTHYWRFVNWTDGADRTRTINFTGPASYTAYYKLSKIPDVGGYLNFFIGLFGLILIGGSWFVLKWQWDEKEYAFALSAWLSMMMIGFVLCMIMFGA